MNPRELKFGIKRFEVKNFEFRASNLRFIRVRCKLKQKQNIILHWKNSLKGAESKAWLVI